MARSRIDFIPFLLILRFSILLYRVGQKNHPRTFLNLELTEVFIILGDSMYFQIRKIYGNQIMKKQYSYGNIITRDHPGPPLH